MIASLSLYVVNFIMAVLIIADVVTLDYFAFEAAQMMTHANSCTFCDSARGLSITETTCRFCLQLSGFPGLCSPRTVCKLGFLKGMEFKLAFVCFVSFV